MRSWSDRHKRVLKKEVPGFRSSRLLLQLELIIEGMVVVEFPPSTKKKTKFQSSFLKARAGIEKSEHDKLDCLKSSARMRVSFSHSQTRCRMKGWSQISFCHCLVSCLIFVFSHLLSTMGISSSRCTSLRYRRFLFVPPTSISSSTASAPGCLSRTSKLGANTQLKLGIP